MAKSYASPLLRKHYPGLDGLRGLAALLVFLHHYLGYPMGRLGGDHLLYWGWTGVELFFVLSGFLITGILYDSLGNSGYFRTFYLRRAFRIFPLYYGVWLALALLTPILHLVWRHEQIAWLFYLGNYFREARMLVILRSPTSAPFQMLIISHFWSLCVEEQFYLAWPLVLFVVRKRNHLMALSLAAIVASTLVRFLVVARHADPSQTDWVYTFTPLRLDGLMMGAWLALMLRAPTSKNNERGLMLLKQLLPLVGVLSATIVVACWLRNPSSAFHAPMVGWPWLKTFGYTLIDLACLALVYTALDPSSVVARYLKNSALSELGKVSYGFYVFHMLLLNTQQHWNSEGRFENFQVSLIIGQFLLTYLAAKLSFHYVESPFLRLKEKFASSPVSTQPYPPPDPAR